MARDHQTCRTQCLPKWAPQVKNLPERSLQGKVTGTELRQDIAELALAIEGMSGTRYVADESAPAGGRFPLAYMNSFGGTIAAGTSEIQRNILGERVLGLAKSK